MEYLVENISWLADQLGDFGEDYLIFDCPGQVELYSHLPVMQTITKALTMWGYRCCAVYLIDSLMINDSTRFFSGVLMCLSAMIQLELPHINVMTKCDLIHKDEAKRNELLEKFFDPNAEDLMRDINAKTTGKYRLLNEAISQLISDYSMVSFLPLDVSSQDSIGLVLQHVDHCIQAGEEDEPRDPDAQEADMNEEMDSETSLLETASSFMRQDL
jgi:GTPase SAR1 family protein